MKTVVKWASLADVVLALVAAAGWIGLWAASEHARAETFPVPPVTLARAADPGAVARGAWIAGTRGCTDCHGADMQGTRFHDDPPVAVVWAPNVTRIATTYADADLVRSVRHGVDPSGRGLLIMPSSTYARLTDAETADLIAWLRSLPAAGPVRPQPRLGGVGRLGLAIGQFRPEPGLVAEAASALPPALGPQHAWARHFVSSACSECHGPALTGSEATHAPDLNVAAAYSSSDFVRLLRTGTASGGRRLGLMTQIAPGRYARLTDEQIGAIHAYLQARAEAAPPG